MTRDIAGLRNSLQQEIASGSLSFQQMAKESYGFFIALSGAPFASDITLKSVAVSDIDSGEFSVTGAATWGIIDGASVTAVFKSLGDDIVADLTLSLPATFALQIPNVDWISLGQIAVNLQSRPRRLMQNPLAGQLTGALRAVIMLGSDHPVPISAVLAPSGNWLIESNFESIEFLGLTS